MYNDKERGRVYAVIYIIMSLWLTFVFIHVLFRSVVCMVWPQWWRDMLHTCNYVHCTMHTCECHGCLMYSACENPHSWIWVQRSAKGCQECYTGAVTYSPSLFIIIYPWHNYLSNCMICYIFETCRVVFVANRSKNSTTMRVFNNNY